MPESLGIRHLTQLSIGQQREICPCLYHFRGLPPFILNLGSRWR